MNSFRGMIKYVDYPLEAAAVLKLEKKDTSTQYVVTTFPTEIFGGDRADKASQSGAPGAAVAMSVHHQEDGTSSHLVSTPSASGRTNEDAKTRTSLSAAPTEASQVGPSGQ